MTNEQFEKIKEAVYIIKNNRGVKKVDGEDFSVYWAGSVIRIDIKGEAVK